MKAELLVEVRSDRGERAGERKRLPASAEGRKRETVLAGGQPSEPRSGSAAAMDDQVRSPRLDRQVRASSFMEKTLQFADVSGL